MSDEVTPSWYVIYQTSDGRVLTGGQMPAAAIADYPPEGLASGTAILEVDRQPNLQTGEWVVSGELADPTTLSPTVSATTFAADGVETATISGLPNPVYVTIQHSVPSVTNPDPDTEVTDTEVESSSTQTGTITVRIAAEGKDTWEGTFDAV